MRNTGFSITSVLGLVFCATFLRSFLPAGFREHLEIMGGQAEGRGLPILIPPPPQFPAVHGVFDRGGARPDAAAGPSNRNAH